MQTHQYPPVDLNTINTWQADGVVLPLGLLL